MGNPLHPSEPGFNSQKDVLELRIPREDISDLAVALIQEIGTDASQALIEKCQELVSEAPDHDDELTALERYFIQTIEDNAGESKREHESNRDYLNRLERDYR